MCFGYRKIDMIKTPDNTLLRSILGSISTKKIVFEVEFMACNGTTERNAGALAAVVGAAAGPVWHYSEGWVELRRGWGA
ncbi:hypothetical protein PSHT_01017 [Puccinia striiformis]|uniref:Uncharacterized protein n=1 Tax=Puccinia striiformis TaxID=27350 RepID=A0A2S4WLG5_9BASI|nr:hypothetical protein PSHT_01017 [Puccinia striiformis]